MNHQKTHEQTSTFDEKCPHLSAPSEWVGAENPLGTNSVRAEIRGRARSSCGQGVGQVERSWAFLGESETMHYMKKEAEYGKTTGF